MNDDDRLLAVGIDGCRAGWIAALGWVGVDRGGIRTRLCLFDDVDQLTRWRESQRDAPNVAIDMPIGLPSRVGYRTCDWSARELLGHPRRNAVFQPPDRELLDAILALEQARFSDVQGLIAERRIREHKASEKIRGLSQQAFFLIDKLGQVDQALRSAPQRNHWLFEFHPEVSFNAMAGEVLAPKKTSKGKTGRLAALTDRFPDVTGRAGPTVKLPWLRREVGLDDIYDAYAGLWTALRFSDGRQGADYEELGDGECDEAALPMRIVI